jgi:hypothetical protein
MELEQSLGRIQSGQGSLGRFVCDPAQYEELRAGLERVRRAVAEVRGSEFVRSDAQYAAWNKRLTSLMRRVDEFNMSPLAATSETYDNLNGVAREARETLRELREEPGKFLRLKLF